MIKACSSVMLSLIAAGCISKNDLLAPSSGANAVTPLLVEAGATGRSAYEDALIARETYRYISGDLKWPSGSGSQCSTAVDRELNEFERRKNAFTVQQAYLQSIADRFKEPQRIDTLQAGVFQAIEGLNALTGSPVNSALLASAKALAGAAVNIVKIANNERMRQQIAVEARRNHANLVSVTSDLINGIVSVNSEITANIKTFEQCEFEKLIYIRDNATDQNIDLEKRYGEYMRKKLAYKGYSVADDKVKKVLQKTVAAHKALFEPSLASPEDVLRELNEAIALMAEFKASVEAYDAARDEFVKRLRN